MNIVTGNIFTSNAQTLVNTVNCTGVMGAGIALEFRLRYPAMHEKYKQLCEDGKVDVGTLWIYKAQDRWILNFPTKKYWKHPSRPEYLHAGLRKFVATYHQKGITSIAFPVLGSDKGGLPQAESLDIMKQHLKEVDADVKIYIYDPSSQDDLFEKTRAWLKEQSVDAIQAQVRIRRIQLEKVLKAFDDPKITQLNQIIKSPGVGIKTLEAVFELARPKSENSQVDRNSVQLGLF